MRRGSDSLSDVAQAREARAAGAAPRGGRVSPARPPKSIKIGAVTYTITLTDEVYDVGEANGLCVPEQQRILLRKTGVHEDTRRYVLWHEIKHAVWFQAGLHEDLAKLDARDHEESVIVRTSPLELAVLRENPKLRDYLFS